MASSFAGPVRCYTNSRDTNARPRDARTTLARSAVLFPAFAATIAPLPTGDLAYQLRVGELMLASGAVLRAV